MDILDKITGLCEAEYPDTNKNGSVGVSVGSEVIVKGVTYVVVERITIDDFKKKNMLEIVREFKKSGINAQLVVKRPGTMKLLSIFERVDGTIEGFIGNGEVKKNV